MDYVLQRLEQGVQEQVVQSELLRAGYSQELCSSIFRTINDELTKDAQQQRRNSFQAAVDAHDAAMADGHLIDAIWFWVTHVNLFRGRLDRTGFLRSITLQTGCVLLVALIVHGPSFQQDTQGGIGQFSAVDIFVSVPFTVLAFSSMVRRLHDIGGSGWWSLLSYLPIMNILLFFYFLFKRGQSQENKYGMTGRQKTITAILGIDTNNTL